jgi:hypothetical protein
MEDFKVNDRVSTPRGEGKIWDIFGNWVDVDLDNKFEQDKKVYKNWLFFKKDIVKINN